MLAAAAAAAELAVHRQHALRVDLPCISGRGKKHQQHQRASQARAAARAYSMLERHLSLLESVPCSAVPHNEDEARSNGKDEHYFKS
jgi:hypothetical protein